MRALLIARKTIWEAWREPQLLGVFLVFPALMIAIYYAAFGQPAQSMARYLNILIWDQDGGAQAQEFVGAIRDMQFEGSPVFGVEMVSAQAEAETSLAEHQAALLLVIPDGFSRSLQSESARPAAVRLVGDPLSDNYAFARSFLSQVVEEFTRGKTGWTDPEPVRYEFVTGTGTLSDFQFGVPGVMVFGILFGVVASALVLVREFVNGTLRRMRLARVRSLDLVLGIVLAMAGLSLVQLPLAFGVALLFGFQSPGSLLLAIGIGLMLSITATGFGMLAAAFARSDGDATNLSTLLMLPLVFLSGAIFPMPPAQIATLGGRTISLYDLMPSTHAAEAMRRVLVYGDGPSEIAYSLAGLTLLSLLSLAVGVWLYQRLRIRSNS